MFAYLLDCRIDGSGEFDPLPDRQGFGYSRLTTSGQLRGEMLVVRMRHRLWGGCRCLIRGDSG